ncbi:MAG: hypothetical protein LBE36_03520 [Flavobacteriaceae bacterium]|jgi:hypothetical protein|nr:hypothetical protein [Flavobacteriaceae bacterium]
MKKALYFIGIVLVIFFLGYKFFNQKEFIRSVKISDAKYIVEFYKEKRFFASSGDGGISGTLGYIRLLDKKGSEIGDTSDCPPFFLGDIDLLDFKIRDNHFYYSRGSAINLKTGRCD